MTDEEYVRSVWVNVKKYADGSACAVVILTGSDEEDAFSSDFERTTKEAAWSAAAEFTRERLEQVRQLREEIYELQDCARSAMGMGVISCAKGRPNAARDFRRYVRLSRILSRLEAELATLTAGMKPGALQ